MPKVKINDVDIYYESHGSGFPLILTYGLGGNTGEWKPQVPELSKAHRLILWDPRGHGQSESPPQQEQYGMDISAEDLHELMNHLDIPEAYVGGLSMGGGISTRFTLAYPERVVALLIIDSNSASGIPASPEGRAEREKRIQLAETQGMEAVAEYAIVSNPSIAGRAGKGPEEVKAIREMYKALNPRGYASTVRAMLTSDSITDRLSQIKVPTLVLAGEEDPALPSARLTHEKISSSKLVIIPQAGHLSNLDQPELFNLEVLKFLTEINTNRSLGKDTAQG
ncbi:alpha/beta fold hydrolase [Chloroflexota bacterium]